MPGPKFRTDSTFVAAQDVDDDGRLDIVVENAIHLNQGGGAFSSLPWRGARPSAPASFEDHGVSRATTPRNR